MDRYNTLLNLIQKHFPQNVYFSVYITQRKRANQCIQSLTNEDATKWSLASARMCRESNALLFFFFVVPILIAIMHIWRPINHELR